MDEIERSAVLALRPMRRVETVEQSCDDPHVELDGQRRDVIDRLEGHAGMPLHLDPRETVFVGALVEDAHDVRMIDERSHTRFFEEDPPNADVARELGPQRFHDDERAVALSSREVNDADAATTELENDLVS